MRAILLLVAAAAMGLGSGCANARFVHKSGDEGIVAVSDRSDSWPSYNITNAKKLIESHVGPEYDVIEEKEVVTGNVTTNQQNTNRDTAVNPFVPFLQAENEVTTTTTSTNPIKEWQIHYRRRMGAPVGTPFGGIRQTGGTIPVQQQMPVTGQRPGMTPQVELPSVMPAGGVSNASPTSVSPAALSGGYPASTSNRNPTITVTGN
jgi:hypothetical protein